MTEVGIEKVQIAANEKFTDPVHVVPIDAPVIICDQFKCMRVCMSHVCISIENIEKMPASERRPNAFDVLMASIVLQLSPPEGKERKPTAKKKLTYPGFQALGCYWKMYVN